MCARNIEKRLNRMQNLVNVPELSSPETITPAAHNIAFRRHNERASALFWLLLEVKPFEKAALRFILFHYIQ